MRKIEILLLVMILLLGIFPRSVELLNRNPVFGFDQGRDFLAAKEIVYDRHFRLIGAEVGGRGGFFQGPGWFYLLSVSSLLARGDPYGGVVMMFLISICILLLAFFLVRKMYDTKTAFFVTFLLSVSPRLISQARLIWAPFPVSLLTVVFLFFLHKAISKPGKYLPLLALTVGLMFHFESAAGAILLMSLIVFSPVIFKKNPPSFRLLLLTLAGLLIPLTPLIVFDLRHNFINSRGIVGLVLNRANPGHKTTLFYAKEMFLNHFSAFRYNFLSTFQFSRILWPFLILFLSLGSISYFKSKDNKKSQKLFLLYLVVSPFIIFLILMLYLWPMWEWWLLELSVFYCLWMALVCRHLYQKPIIKFFIIILLLVSTGSSVIQTINYYRYDLNDFGGTHKLKGKIEAIDYIYQDAPGPDFGLLIFTPPSYTYAFDYLIWWYGSKKYGYIPHQRKEGTFYLLIEPDPHKPWTYKGWLETVIKGGQILKEETLPSGFIIQKRYAEK